MITNFDISNTTPMINGRVETNGEESRLKLRQTSYEAARTNIQKCPVVADESKEEMAGVENELPMNDVAEEVSIVDTNASSEQPEVSTEGEEQSREETSDLDVVSFTEIDDHIYGSVEAKALKVKPAKVETMLSSVSFKSPEEDLTPTEKPDSMSLVPSSQEMTDTVSSEISTEEPVEEKNETSSVAEDTSSVTPDDTTVSKKEFIPLDVPRESLVDEFSNLTEFNDLLKALDQQRTATIDAQARVSEKQGEFDRLSKDANDVFATSENNLREAERKKMEAEKRFQSAEETNEQLKRRVKELVREQQKVMEDKEKEAHEFVGHLDSQIDELNNGKYRTVTNNNEQAEKYLVEAGIYNQNADELEKRNADFNQLLEAMAEYEGMTSGMNGEDEASYSEQEEETYHKAA